MSKKKEDDISVADGILVGLIATTSFIGMWMLIAWTISGIGNAIGWFQNVDEKLGEIPYGFTCSVDEKEVTIGTNISCPINGIGKCTTTPVKQKKMHLYGCENGDHISVPFDQ